ncbi:hypothetical protein HOLleu_02882 [Holothuria leucospilota]|uniref:Uncharacterized protein n=1 Tax=Holothuria leucospilota TaxID=206669 RepID=A0A9Q1HHB6_HOLLE|nr:hypothetical protein HOLleu_02882 [Holothuria leucospilota]
MGHDISVHRQYYRLPQEVLLLAKVSKHLLASEAGKLHLYQGKSFDEINIDPGDTAELTSSTEDDINDDDNTGKDSDASFDIDDPKIDLKHTSLQQRNTKVLNNKKKSAKRTPWSSAETNTDVKHSGPAKCLRERRTPAALCYDARKNNKALSNRYLYRFSLRYVPQLAAEAAVLFVA